MWSYLRHRLGPLRQALLHDPHVCPHALPLRRQAPGTMEALCMRVMSKVGRLPLRVRRRDGVCRAYECSYAPQLRPDAVGPNAQLVPLLLLSAIHCVCVR